MTSPARTGPASRRLRICFITSYDVRGERAGGASDTVYRLACHFAPNHDVTIASFSDTGHRLDGWVDGVRVVLLPHSPTSVRARWALLREPRVRESDVVVESSDAGGPWFTFSAKRRVLLAHQLWQEVFEEEVRSPFGALLRRVEPWFYRPYRNVPAILGSRSDSAARSLRGVGVRNLLVVPFGFRPDSTDSPPRAARELRGTPTLTIVSRLRRYKGIQFAIAAMPEMLEAYPDLTLVVAGRGPYRESLEELARGLGVADSVKFLGYVDHARLKELLNRSYVSLAPSIREGYGFNVVDAFRSGTPVVGWAVPGTRDAVEDGVTGLLVTPFSIQRLARAVRSLLDAPDERDRLAASAYRWARSLNWEDSLDRIDELICSTGSSSGGPTPGDPALAAASDKERLVDDLR